LELIARPLKFSVFAMSYVRAFGADDPGSFSARGLIKRRKEPHERFEERSGFEPFDFRAGANEGYGRLIKFASHAGKAGAFRRGQGEDFLADGCVNPNAAGDWGRDFFVFHAMIAGGTSAFSTS
jgi:hypothetical protein